MKQLNKIKNIIEQMISQPNSYCDPSVLSYLLESLNKEDELKNLKFTIYDSSLVLNLTAYLQYKNQRTLYSIEDYLEIELDKFSHDYIIKEKNQQIEILKVWEDTFKDLNIKLEPFVFNGKEEENYIDVIFAHSNFENWLLKKVHEGKEIPQSVEKSIFINLLTKNDSGYYYSTNIEKAKNKDKINTYLIELWSKYSDVCIKEIKQKNSNFNLIDLANKKPIVKYILNLVETNIVENEIYENVKKASQEENYRRNPDLSLKLLKENSPEKTVELLSKNGKFSLSVVWGDKLLLTTGRSISKKNHTHIIYSALVKDFIEEIKYIGKQIKKVDEETLTKFWVNVMESKNEDLISAVCVYLRLPDLNKIKDKNENDQKRNFILKENFENLWNDSIDIELLNNKKESIIIKDLYDFLRKKELNQKLEQNLNSKDKVKQIKI